MSTAPRLPAAQPDRGARGQVLSPSSLDARCRDVMYGLFERYYARTNRETFEQDLDAKDWVVLVRDEDDRVAGFTTGRLVEARVGERPVSAIYSGDTIVDKSQWRRSTLARTWGRLMLSLLDEHEGRELGWFLICQGYRTYRFLPVFYREYSPRHARPTPADVTARIAAFGRALFGARFDESAGIVRADEHAYVLRPGVADVDGSSPGQAHVGFFAAANPGHVQGDQLCCWAPLSRANLRPAAWRVMGLAPPS